MSLGDEAEAKREPPTNDMSKKRIIVEDNETQSPGEAARSVSVDADPSGAGDELPVPGGASLTDAAGSETADPSTPEMRIEQLENALLRAKADYQNLSRRLTAERQEAVRFANADLMRSITGVLDDFDRAIAAAEGEAESGFVQGVRLVRENLLKALSDHGLAAIEAAGQPFDPAQHEALMQQPSSEHAPGTVVEEVSKGYSLRDRVIRPSKVIVAGEPSGEASDN